MDKKIINTFPIVAISIAWFFTFYQGISTAIDIWIVSEIFNHCLLVIPTSCFLIYQKREQIYQQSINANYWLLLPLIGTLVLYTFGSVGDIRLFMHVATFASLPLLIWYFIGNQAAKIIAFPLFFILFSIPFGEQFIPFLQEVTTDLAVPLLEFTGVPTYRNGLYLDIPEGRFLVAEACSGISFLITSIVFGNLYAYISFRSMSKKILFIGISIILPVIANAIRVYGIVLIAHLTDMEYAAGADHLIYGGVFFAFILFLLIMIGEKLRDKTETPESQKSISKTGADEKAISLSNKLVRAFVVLILLFASQIIWLSNLMNNESIITDDEFIVDLRKSTLPFSFNEAKLNKWQPNFLNASNIQQGYIKSSNNLESIDFFVATYLHGEGELISSLNKLYDTERWALINVSKVKIKNFAHPAQLTELVSPNGEKRVIIHWYQLGNESFSVQTIVKLYQTARVMLGIKEQASVIAFSLETNERLSLDNQTLIKFLENNNSNIKKIFSEINN